VDEVHAPALRRADRHRGGAAMEGDVLPATDAHAQLQALEPIQSAHAFVIHSPALPSQQPPDALIAEPRSRMRQLANA
jgi:hypothetical protein